MADLPSASQTAATVGILTNGTTYYLALYTADPGTSGATGEVTGGSYARQVIQFTNGVSTDAQAFTGMPTESGNLWIGIWTASTGGTFKWGGSSAAVTGPVTAGQSVNFAIGAVTAAIT